MDIQVLKDGIPTSPAFVVDEITALKAFKALADLGENCGCKVLYSIKALPLTAVLEIAKFYIDGFSVSSLFEARMADEILAGQGSLHLTTPGIRPDEIDELASVCSHISCNSLGQYRQVDNASKNRASLGIRVNPQLSFADDARYDPCRVHSKLGVNLDDLLNCELSKKIKGLHFHTVFSATNYLPLIQTVAKLRQTMGANIGRLDWLNIGGGYLFDEIGDNACFIEMVRKLKADFDVEIYIEPGNAVIGKSGCLLTTVIDCFTSEGKAIAILDTSVNHHPQVFEYQRQPELAEHDSNGLYSFVLAGCTCLAGDLFGEYRFSEPLKVGDKLVFKNVGAYSLVKANRFNGYNLPDIYLTNTGKVSRIKQHTYLHYRQQWVSDD